MGRGAVEATSLGCLFCVINPRVLSANKVDFGLDYYYYFINIRFYSPPPPGFLFYPTPRIPGGSRDGRGPHGLGETVQTPSTGPAWDCNMHIAWHTYHHTHTHTHSILNIIILIWMIHTISISTVMNPNKFRYAIFHTSLILPGIFSAKWRSECSWRGLWGEGGYPVRKG